MQLRDNFPESSPTTDWGREWERTYRCP